VVRELLEKAGVDTRGLIRSEGIATSQTLIVNVQGQDRRFIHTYGSNSRFVAADIPVEPTPEILYLGGYLLNAGLSAGGTCPGSEKGPGQRGKDHPGCGDSGQGGLPSLAGTGPSGSGFISCPTTMRAN